MANLFSNACDEPLLIPFKKVKIGQEIGRGSFGKVFEVVFEKTSYAAKEIHSILLEPAGSKNITAANFMRECHIWSQLHHPRIVQFMG